MRVGFPKTTTTTTTATTNQYPTEHAAPAHDPKTGLVGAALEAPLGRSVGLNDGLIVDDDGAPSTKEAGKIAKITANWSASAQRHGTTTGEGILQEMGL